MIGSGLLLLIRNLVTCVLAITAEREHAQIALRVYAAPIDLPTPSPVAPTSGAPRVGATSFYR